MAINQYVTVSGVDCQVQRAVINAATATDHTLVAAQSGKRIVLLGAFLIATAAVTATFKSGTSTSLSGGMALGANGGLVMPTASHGYLETANGEALTLTLGGAVQVSGAISYAVVPA